MALKNTIRTSSSGSIVLEEKRNDLPVDSLGVMVSLIQRIQQKDFANKLMVLVLEDSHLLDSASVRLVHRLLEAGITMMLALRDNDTAEIGNATAVGGEDSLEFDGTTFLHADRD